MNWKTATIILAILLLITNGYWFWQYSAGIEMVKNEEKCASKCTANEEYIAYSYDWFTEMCYCVDKEENYHEISL